MIVALITTGRQKVVGHTHSGVLVPGRRSTLLLLWCGAWGQHHYIIKCKSMAAASLILYLKSYKATAGYYNYMVWSVGDSTITSSSARVWQLHHLHCTSSLTKPFAGYSTGCSLFTLTSLTKYPPPRHRVNN